MLGSSVMHLRFASKLLGILTSRILCLRSFLFYFFCVWKPNTFESIFAHAYTVIDLDILWYIKVWFYADILQVWVQIKFNWHISIVLFGQASFREHFRFKIAALIRIYVVREARILNHLRYFFKIGWFDVHFATWLVYCRFEMGVCVFDVRLFKYLRFTTSG